MKTAQHSASVTVPRMRALGTTCSFSEISPLLSDMIEFLSETAGGCVMARFPSLARLVLSVEEVSESRIPGTKGGPATSGPRYPLGSIAERVREAKRL